MLILSRRVGETICISNDIKVTVIDVRGNIVKLGIVAPKTTPVHREEIQKRIQAEKEQDNDR